MATTKGFTVTTERLDEAAQYIKDKTERYNSDVQRLYSETEAMTSTMWKGVASETYRTKLESYRGDFESMKSALNQFAENLLVKSKNYIGTENNTTNAAQRL